MPYELHGNCVHKVGDSKPLKCYDNHADALAYLRALEANVEDAKMMMLTQDEVNYTPHTEQHGQECEMCRWFDKVNEGGPHCHLVMGHPMDILPTGHCDRYEAPSMMDEPAPMPVTIVEPEMEMGEMSVDEQTLFTRIWGRIQKALMPADNTGAFTVQKDLNGVWRWVATFSNNFQDREKEIISEKAWDGYLDRIAMQLVPMPELWLGHIEGTKHGVADMVFGVGNFITAVGHFDSPEIGEQAARYAKRYPQTPLSHGFTFPGWALKDGIYEVINTFEISILPPPLVASNPFTEFEVNSMKGLTPETEAALALYFGKDKAEAIKSGLQQKSEDIKAAGVAFKDFVETTESTPAETAKPEVAAAMGDLLSQILEGQGELLNLLTGAGKAITALKAQVDSDKAAAETRIKALETENARLSSELKLTPRAASTAASTKLTDAEAKAVKDQLDTLEADPFFS